MPPEEARNCTVPPLKIPVQRITAPLEHFSRLSFGRLTTAVSCPLLMRSPLEPESLLVSRPSCTTPSGVSSQVRYCCHSAGITISTEVLFDLRTSTLKPDEAETPVIVCPAKRVRRTILSCTWLLEVSLLSPAYCPAKVPAQREVSSSNCLRSRAASATTSVLARSMSALAFAISSSTRAASGFARETSPEAEILPRDETALPEEAAPSAFAVRSNVEEASFSALCSMAAAAASIASSQPSAFTGTEPPARDPALACGSSAEAFRNSLTPKSPSRLRIAAASSG